MNEKKKLQPKVRFREFTGENAPDWEQRKLGEVGDFNPKCSLPKKFEYVDLESVDGTRLVSHRTEYIDNAPSRAQRLAKPGDIFYQTVRPYQKNNYLFNIADSREYVFSTGYAQIRPYGNSEYLMALIQGKEFVRKVLNNCTGTSYPAINSKDLEKISIFIPKINEQERIGEFFEKIDKLITLHQRKLEQLEQLKNTLLSKMFPKSGTNIPEIRFSGFTDAWKQRKAKEIFITISEKGHIDLPVLSASQEFGMVERNNIGIDIKYDLNSIKNYKRVLPKQFVIHLRSFQGGFAWSTIEGITSPAYTVIDFIEKSNQDFGFWKIFLTSTNFIKKLETVTYGIRDGRSISFNDFSSMNFVIPNINEQERIGNLFQKIDNYIAIHQRKLEQLKNLKQTLLNKMFI